MTITELIKKQYKEGLGDYWMPPLTAEKNGHPYGIISSGDTLFFCCRRGEREIQLTESFVEPDFNHFPRENIPDLNFISMVRYHEKFSSVPSVFPSVNPENVLTDILSRKGKKQMAISESEKEAHVTYFFNGRRNSLSADQKTIIIPSWKNFQDHPEMKSREVGDAVLNELDNNDFILVNFPAGDVIGHLADFDIKVKSIEVIDSILGEVIDKAIPAGYTVLIAADHGLIERGRNPDGTDSISHTSAQVRFIAADRELKNSGINISENGSLQDIAPTILNLMGLPVPEEMTGRSLIQKEKISEKILFIILDGWGIGEEDANLNPIFAAETPVFDSLIAEYPNTAINASGSFVGLPEGRSGNSETGHLTMGSGRIIKQDELRIRDAMAENFKNNSLIKEMFDRIIKQKSSLHLLGLLTEVSSHGSIEEVVKIIALANEAGVKQIYLHLILDGRSSPPRGAAEMLERYCDAFKNVKIVSAAGRGYALDRSRDYKNKTAPVYRSLVYGEGIHFQIME
jgi:2,3-bisphosphoglycerate-independent phosphoglycerate mutase